MTFSKAEFEYENRYPRMVPSDHTNKLAKSFELVIRSSILTNLKYTCLDNSGDDISLCPVSQVAEEMWTEHEKCREAIKAAVDGSTDEEIGAKFRVLVESIIGNIAADCAETKITQQELEQIK